MAALGGDHDRRDRLAHAPAAGGAARARRDRPLRRPRRLPHRHHAAWHGLVIPGFGRELPDAVLVRGIAGGSFEQVTKRLGVLHALREFGVPVYNDARAIERSVDKSMTSLLLHARRHPDAADLGHRIGGRRRSAVVMRESAAGHALVLKPLFGSQGKGLQRSARSTACTCPDLEPYGGVAYLQRFVPADDGPASTGACWWSAAAPSARCAASSGTGSTTWRKARAARAPTAAEPLRLAEACRAALELDYAGVDLMPRRSAPMAQVIEVNGVAAWHGLQRVTGFNIARALVDDLLARKLPRVAGPARAA